MGATSMLTDDLLDSLDESTSDVTQAATLPAELYTNEEFLRFEYDALFAREWLCVGRASRIPNPGDWFTITIAEEPLIVVRDKQGEINCLSVVCQHRAKQERDGRGKHTAL